MQATLRRIDQVNGPLNAIVSLRDGDILLSEARDVDRQVGPKGPLSGIPIAIKDLANAAGLPTSQGSMIFAGQIATQDSLHVARLRKAGAIIIGKTNTPEFGLGSHTYNPVFGPTCNAYASHLSSGGSSGGAAVALASGMLGVADGSDMMGSLRNPAGWNNIYSLRPSWGRVPGEPSDDMFLHQLSTNGPMARCPRDLTLMLNIMSGPDSRQPLRAEYGPVEQLQELPQIGRIGWLSDWGGQLPFEEGILDLCQTALGVFESLGWDVQSIVPSYSLSAIWDSWVVLRSWAIACGLGKLASAPDMWSQLKPEAQWEITQGLALNAMQVHQASVLRSEWFTSVSHLFDDYDVLALPTAQIWPFDINMAWPTEISGQEMDTYHRWMQVVTPVSLIGLPAVTIPAGFGENGLPMGIQFFARQGEDAKLLSIAEHYHQTVNWPKLRPPDLTQYV